MTLPGATFTPATNVGDGLYYNRTLARWVAWAPSALAEDGTTYAYVEGNHTFSRVHLVDLKKTTDRILVEGGPWSVVGLQPDAVYLTLVEYSESAAFGVLENPRGLWKVPLTGSGAVQLTDDTIGWFYVSKGAAWASSSRSLNIAGAPSDILRLDLQTMKLTTWFAPGTRTAVLAIDASGVPLIASEADFYDLWRVPAPDGAIKLWSTPYKEMGPYGPVAVDGNVIWFSSRSLASESGIYRYSAAQGVELVASFTDPAVWVAGPCA